jgi:hypothetical protein
MLPRPEHRGAVRHDGDQVAAHGEVARLVRDLDDRLARGRHRRGVGERQVALRDERLGRRDLDLAGDGLAVVFERALLEVVEHSFLSP